MAPERASLRRRAALVALVGAVCVAASVAYVAKRAAERREQAASSAATSPSAKDLAELVRRVRARSHLLFVEPRAGDRPRVAFAPLDAGERASFPNGRVVT